MRDRIRAAFVLVVLLAGSATAFLKSYEVAPTQAAGAGDWRQDRRAVQESLASVHPRMRARWLRDRSIADSHYSGAVRSDSGDGLRLVGRWSYGPSFDVDGRVSPSETLVALARGSGVSLIRSARTDSVELELLSDINAGGIMKRVWVQDSLLYAGSTAGLEIWDIGDARNPALLSRLRTALNDFALRDSFAYVIGPDDSFKVYNVADARNPVPRGACRDSGYSVAVTGNLALVGDRWGLYLLDVSDPAAPLRLNSWGSAIDAMATRGDLACVTQFNPNQPGELRLNTLDVSDPQNVRQLGALNGAGGLDIHLQDTLVFCSGDGNDHSLKIVSIADSSQPRLLGAATSPGWGQGVWASGQNKAAFYASNYEGMQVFDVTNTAGPVRDTSALGADLSRDVCIDLDIAHVANSLSGLHVLSIADPARPTRLGGLDTAGTAPDARSVVARDSFAYAGWSRPSFRSFDVSDPARPRPAGGCEVFNRPEDMVLRDTLCYVAEMRRLQVLNVARPREPLLVGNCVTQDGVYFGLAVQDSLAYLISGSLQVINVARPANPVILSTTDVSGCGVAVRDTLVYVPYVYDTLRVYSAANPQALRLLCAVPLRAHAWDVALAESTAVVATFAGLELFCLENPSQPRWLGASAAPGELRRIVYAEPYWYAAMWGAGIAIYSTDSVGVSEASQRPVPRLPPVVRPNPARSRCQVARPWPVREARLYDATGRTMAVVSAPGEPEEVLTLDLSRLAPGVYFVAVKGDRGTATVKLVKQ